MDDDKLHEGGGLWDTVCITAVPALAMTIGSAAISLGAPSEILQVRLQHLSAGLLIGACLADIFPILQARLVTPGAEHKVDWYSLFAAFCGFGGAMLVMYGVKSLGLDEGDEDSHAGDDKPNPDSLGSPSKAGLGLASPGDLLRPLTGVAGAVAGQEADQLRVHFSRLSHHVGFLKELVSAEEVEREPIDEQIHTLDFLIDQARRLARGAEPLDKRNTLRMRHHVLELEQDVLKLIDMDMDQCGPIDKQLRVVAGTLRHIHSHTDRGGFRRWAVQSTRRWSTADSIDDEQATSAGASPALPVALILAVIVDSVIDGMLIGLATSVATESGWLMALATAIEMGFLGYSFASSILKSGKRPSSIAIIALPPLAMLCSASAATMGAAFVKDSPAFVGLIAFALVALLFLVVDELLAEAHEEEASKEWHVSIFLYIGLLISICLDVIF